VCNFLFSGSRLPSFLIGRLFLASFIVGWLGRYLLSVCSILCFTYIYYMMLVWDATLTHTCYKPLGRLPSYLMRKVLRAYTQVFQIGKRSRMCIEIIPYVAHL
jgi:hypothetical protein